MSPLLQGIVAIMVVVLVANVAVIGAAVWLWLHEPPKRTLVLQGGTARRRRPVSHRERGRA